MPVYLFEHTTTGEVHEVVFHMVEDKVYNGPKGNESGKWRRVWTKPRAAIDTKVDPYSAKDYVKATNKPGTVADLWDRAKEASIKRADKEGGTDPVRQEYYKRYSKRRGGKQHPEQRREESVKTLAKSGIKVDWGTDD